MHNTRLRNRTENKAFIKYEGDDQYCTLHTDKQCAQQVILGALKCVIMHP
jgi:hypothetical protein